MSILNNPATKIAAGIAVTGITLSLLGMILPTWGTPAPLINAVGWALAKLWSFNFIIPVSVLIRCFQIWLTFEMTAISIKVLFFIVDQITDASN